MLTSPHVFPDSVTFISLSFPGMVLVRSNHSRHEGRVLQKYLLPFIDLKNNPGCVLHVTLGKGWLLFISALEKVKVAFFWLYFF